MKPITLKFYSSQDHKPETGQDGKKFLLCWGGWQYDVHRWSAEQSDFYNNSKDYLEDWSNPFVWAELPDNLNEI